jgi:hypothetical protein
MTGGSGGRQGPNGRAPHPATVVQPKPAFGGVAELRPHPATVQAKGLPPHPATVMRRGAPHAAAGAVQPARKTVGQSSSQGTAYRSVGWAIIDPNEQENEKAVVVKNITSANSQRRYDCAWITTTASRNVGPVIKVQSGATIHVHAHGNEETFACTGPNGLAEMLHRKFGDDLAKCVIVLHGCEVGQGNFIEDLLNELHQRKVDGTFDGLTVYAPVGLLMIAEKDGLSYVGKEGTTSSDLRLSEKTVDARFGKIMSLCLPFGQGWKRARLTYKRYMDYSQSPATEVTVHAVAQDTADKGTVAGLIGTTIQSGATLRKETIDE